MVNVHVLLKELNSTPSAGVCIIPFIAYVILKENLKAVGKRRDLMSFARVTIATVVEWEIAGCAIMICSCALNIVGRCPS